MLEHKQKGLKGPKGVGGCHLSGYLIVALLFQSVLPMVLALPGAGVCDATQRMLRESSSGYQQGHQHGHQHAHDHAGDQLTICLCSLKQVAKLIDLDAVTDMGSVFASTEYRPVATALLVDFREIALSHWHARAPPWRPIA